MLPKIIGYIRGDDDNARKSKILVDKLKGAKSDPFMVRYVLVSDEFSSLLINHWVLLQKCIYIWLSSPNFPKGLGGWIDLR